MSSLLKLLFLIISSCQSPHRASPQQGAVTLFFQSNRFGNLETCGCHSNPYGGIDRELNAMNQLRRDVGTSLTIDAGNLFVPKDRTGSVEYYRHRAQLMIPLLAELGLEVFSPGPSDLILGISSLKILSSSARFRFVSSNVSGKRGERPFARSVSITKSGIRLGIIAVTPVSAASGDFQIEDPKGAIGALLPLVAKSNDLVILLSQLGNKLDSELAAQFPAISVIIGADEILATERAQWFQGHTLIVDPDLNGYLLGRLSLDVRFPFEGLYSARDIESNKTLLRQYQERGSSSGGEKYAQYAAEMAKTTQLSIPEGASLYDYELIKLDAKRFGSKNAMSGYVHSLKESMKKFSITSQ